MAVVLFSSSSVAVLIKILLACWVVSRRTAVFRGVDGGGGAFGARSPAFHVIHLFICHDVASSLQMNKSLRLGFAPKTRISIVLAAI